MGLRVSTSLIYQQAESRMLDNLEKLYLAQQRLTTGKKILKPSDDPAAMSRITGYRGVEARINQYQRNISMASGYLSEAESALTGISNLLVRAKELAIQGASGAVGADSLKAIAGEVRNLQEQMLSQANANWSAGGSSGDRFIFSGYRTDTPAFAADGTYQGDQGEYQVEVGLGEWMTVGLAGDRVLQGSVDVFAVMSDLRDALEAGDTEAVRGTLSGLDSALVQVSSGTAEVGARMSRLEQVEARLGDTLLSVQTFISQEEDVDLAAAASQVTLLKTVLEASVSSTRIIFSTLQLL